MSHGLMRLGAPPVYGPSEIRRLRRRFKCGKTVFGRMVGVSPVTIWQWETGKVKPSGPARQILHYLNAGILKIDPKLFVGKPGRPRRCG